MVKRINFNKLSSNLHVYKGEYRPMFANTHTKRV